MGAALKVEAQRIAKPEASARANVMWNAEAATDLFCFFFMDWRVVATSRCDVSGELSGWCGLPTRSGFVLGRLQTGLGLERTALYSSAENVSRLLFQFLKKILRVSLLQPQLMT